MNNLNKAISKNISNLRKSAHLTQAELAEKLGYSDKAVSKWERGDGIPDIATLLNIAELFGTTVDYLIRDNSCKPPPKIPAVHKRSHIIITMLSVLCVWFIAVVLFVSFGISGAVSKPWIVFIAAIPVSLIVLLVFNSIWGNITFNFPIISALIWTFLTFVYLLIPEDNRWMLFLIGIPLQIGVILWYALISPAVGKNRKASGICTNKEENNCNPHKQ